MSIQRTEVKPEFPEALLHEADGARFARPIPFGNYTLLALVRRSAMSLVVRGVRVGSNEPVAVKICLPGADKERFQREILHTRSVGIRGVIKIEKDDVGETQNGRPFYATRWIDGPNLAEFLHDARTPADAKLAAVIELCRIVGVLHERGLSHRDLKPSNVMAEPGGDVTLLDLGLARTAGDRDLTMAGTHVGGTEGYRPSWGLRDPHLNRLHETRWDVYSLAVILVEALTGVTPAGDHDPRFTPDGVRALFARHRPGDPRFLELLEACFSPDPNLLPAQADAMYHALRRSAARRSKSRRSPVAALVMTALLGAAAYIAWRQWPTVLRPEDPVRVLAGTTAPPVPLPAAVAPALDSRIIPHGGATNAAVHLKVSPTGAVVRIVDHRANGRLVVPEQIVPVSGELDVSIPADPKGDYGLVVSKPGWQVNNQGIQAGGGPVSVQLERLRGEVEFRTTAGATISLLHRDGTTRTIDSVPATGVVRVQSLDEGDWSYRVDLAHHAPVSGWITNLVSGRIHSLRTLLSPLPGRVSIVGHPTLEIWSGTNRLGRANDWLPLPAGEQDLELRRRGFRTARLTVQIPPEQDVSRIAPDLAVEPDPVLPPDLIEVADAKPAPLAGLAEGSEKAQREQIVQARALNLPLEVRMAKLGVPLRLIPAGSVLMGSPTGEPNRDDDEAQFTAVVSRGFFLAKFEFTRRQVRQLLGTDPSFFKGDEDAPVENMSWDEVQAVPAAACKYEGVPAGTYFLVTEAQWEYACRAGTTGATYGALDQIAWHGGNSDSKTYVVGGKLANAYGLHDMIGNVWEWTADAYGPYPRGTVTDPAGPGSGADRVYRGGSWSFDARLCRSAERFWFGSGFRDRDVGFRLARRLP